MEFVSDIPGSEYLVGISCGSVSTVDGEPLLGNNFRKLSVARDLLSKITFCGGGLHIVRNILHQLLSLTVKVSKS